MVNGIQLLNRWNTDSMQFNQKAQPLHYKNYWFIPTVPSPQKLLVYSNCSFTSQSYEHPIIEFHKGKNKILSNKINLSLCNFSWLKFIYLRSNMPKLTFHIFASVQYMPCWRYVVGTFTLFLHKLCNPLINYNQL